MAIVFGLAAYGNAIAGLHLQTVVCDETGTAAEALREDGAIEQIDMYERKRTIRAEGNVVEGGDLSALTVGGSLTVDSVTYTIESVTLRSTAAGHRRCTVTGVAPIR